MNLFTDGVVAEDAVQFPSFRLPLPSQVKAQLQSGQRVTLGVRPEALRLVDGTTNPTEGVILPSVILRGVAEVVEPDFGRQSQLVYAAQDEFRFVAMGDLQIPLFAGYPVTAHLQTDQLHFFDATSERRIG